jgi:hypothetical protein
MATALSGVFIFDLFPLLKFVILRSVSVFFSLRVGPKDLVLEVLIKLYY